MSWSHPPAWLPRLTGLLAVTCSSTPSRATDGDVVDESSLLPESGAPLNTLPLARTLQQKAKNQDSDIEDGEEEDLLPESGAPLKVFPLLARTLQQKAKNQDSDIEDGEEEEDRLNGTATGGGTHGEDLVTDVPTTALLPILPRHFEYKKRGQSSISGRGSEVGSSPSAPASDGSSHLLPGRLSSADSPSKFAPEAVLVLHRLTYDPGTKQDRQDREWGGLLSGLDAYFQYLGVDDVDCRLKFLCQMYDDPQTPTSVPRLSAFDSRRSRSLKKPQVATATASRFLYHHETAHVSSSTASSSSSSCARRYSNCSVSAKDITNTQVFLFVPLWQKLTNYVSMGQSYA